MEQLDILVTLACIIGVIGAIVQIYPGLLIVSLAVGIWGAVTQGPWGWAMLAAAILTFIVASVGKYILAGKRLKNAGVANSSMMIGGVLAVVGFFVIPVIGAVVGFVAGVYLGEARRSRSGQQAWQSTVHALKSVGLAILVELFAALALSAAWGWAAWMT
ncbi:hypothetical protein SAMN02910418_01010 [Bowdeniella nasicola]|uniref:DUF456 domain-containing protein n=1 Tax=Bowdeniella nasicola TaxID=208480 RepID=A0A1H3YVK3_9ACTO|nr:DUF456 domain-containing protein [Bowdeniella nasicola]SEA15526.1 hypothetical protein SAMN02910418_01010 [Bowdeniella nasicola]